MEKWYQTVLLDVVLHMMVLALSVQGKDGRAV
jgi:hypothetical protein